MIQLTDTLLADALGPDDREPDGAFGQRVRSAVRARGIVTQVRRAERIRMLTSLSFAGAFTGGGFAVWANGADGSLICLALAIGGFWWSLAGSETTAA